MLHKYVLLVPLPLLFHFRQGSVIVYFYLLFSKGDVSGDDLLKVFADAVTSGNFGNYTVDKSSLSLTLISKYCFLF